MTLQEALQALQLLENIAAEANVKKIIHSQCQQAAEELRKFLSGSKKENVGEQDVP